MQLLNAVSIPTLLRLYQSGHIKPSNLFTHRKWPIECPYTWPGFAVLYLNLATDYPFSEVHKAYHSFQMAAQEGALKVAIDF